MSFPTDTFLQFFRNSSNYIAQEFENFYAQLEGYLRQEHKDDGTHGDVNATSVTLAPTSTALGGSISLGTPSGYPEYVIRIDNDSVPRVTFGWVPPTNPTPFGSASPTYINGGLVTQGGIIAVDQGNGSDISGGKYIESTIYAAGMGYWTSYTSTWTTSGTAPALGTGGAIVGEYTRIGETVWYGVQITLGTGFGFGTGTMGVTLPVAIDTTNPIGQHQAYAIDVSTGPDLLPLLSVIRTISGTVMPSFNQWASPLATITTTAPITFAAGDILRMQGYYRVA